MLARQESVRLFDNDLLERLSRVHPLTPVLLWAPIIAWLLWRSLTVHRLEGATVAILGIGGLVAWTLTEYLVHRFVFHLRPEHSEPPAPPVRRCTGSTTQIRTT